MALIGMAVYDTVENNRSKFTLKTLSSLARTVNWNKHRLIVVDNNSCDLTKENLEYFRQSDSKLVDYIPNMKIITLNKNIGTAEAINLAWRERYPGEHCVKMDNDVVIHQIDWLDDLEECIRRMPLIGQIGLKRKDLVESPLNSDPTFTSKLRMLPHEKGEKWLVIEQVKHVIGTCVLHSSTLLDKVGYLFQIEHYGYDDSFMSHRSIVSGMINCFLPSVEIDHIDPGGDAYTEEKRLQADKVWQEYQRVAGEIISRKRTPYYNPFNNGAYLSQIDQLVDLEKTID